MRNWIKFFRNQIVSFWNLKSLYFICSNLSLFVVILAVICCHCHSLSCVVTCCTTRYHLLYNSLSFVITRCTSRCHSMHHSFVFLFGFAPFVGHQHYFHQFPQVSLSPLVAILTTNSSFESFSLNHKILLSL